MRRLSLASVVVCLAVAGCTPAPRGAAWHMDEPSGTTTVVDSVGGHDGRATDVVFGEPGYQGSAYRFNGTTSIVRVPHGDGLDPGTGAFAFGGWVNFNELPPERTWDVLRKGVTGTAGGNYKLELFTGNGTARARCVWKDGQGTSISVVRGSNLHDGGWHELTCRRNGSTFSLTVDSATSSNTASLGSIANTAELTIGAKATDSDVFKGRIDEAWVSFGAG